MDRHVLAVRERGLLELRVLASGGQLNWLR